MNAVVFMKQPLDEITRSEIESKVDGLEYWHEGGTPHNQEQEGYGCAKCRVDMAFPVG